MRQRNYQIHSEDKWFAVGEVADCFHQASSSLFDNNHAETRAGMNIFCLKVQTTAAAPLHSLLSDLFLLLGKLFLIVCDS